MDTPINDLDTLNQVPTIDTRTEIPFKIIQLIVRRIAERYKPEKVILFGSYARGNPRPESDVDLLVVMETPLKETHQVLEIRKDLNPLFGLDLIVYTPQNLAQRLDWGDSFLQEIINHGKVLYESSDA
jgi:uncharacterized protein